MAKISGHASVELSMTDLFLTPAPLFKFVRNSCSMESYSQIFLAHKFPIMVAEASQAINQYCWVSGTFTLPEK